MPLKRAPEWYSWKCMRQRCNRPADVKYKWYGARGIKVCDRWLGADGFKNFLADMGPKPSPKHTLDRVDGNGNYEPSNCRWATPTEQRLNQRRPTYAPRPWLHKMVVKPSSRPNKWGFRGVYFDNTRDVFCAQIGFNKKHKTGPARATAAEAARDYDALALKHHGSLAILNFPDASGTGASLRSPDAQTPLEACP